MSGSQVIETAIGLALLLFLLSTAVTAVSELIAQMLNLRGKKLYKALGRLLGDKKLAAAFRTSPVIADLEGKYMKMTRKASYIAAQDFAIGLVDTIRRYDGEGGLNAPDDGPVVDAAAWADAVMGLPPILRQRLQTIAIDATATLGQQYAAVRKGIEDWFDHSMDRVEGWYRRQTRWVVLVIGAVLTIGLGVDTIDVAEHLWDSPVARAATADAAAAIANVEAERAAEAAPNDTIDTSRVRAAVEEVQALEESGIPIGWGEGFTWGDSVGDAATALGDKLESEPLKIVGLLLTIVLLSLGAPFWFDVLSRLSSLRAAGSKPAKGGTSVGGAAAPHMLEGMMMAAAPSAESSGALDGLVMALTGPIPAIGDTRSGSPAVGAAPAEAPGEEDDAVMESVAELDNTATDGGDDDE